MRSSSTRIAQIEKRLKPKNKQEELRVFIVDREKGKYYEKKGKDSWEEVDIKKYGRADGINVLIDSRFVHGFTPPGMGIKNGNFA